MLLALGLLADGALGEIDATPEIGEPGGGRMDRPRRDCHGVPIPGCGRLVSPNYCVALSLSSLRRESDQSPGDVGYVP